MSDNQSLIVKTKQAIRPLRGRVLIAIEKEFDDEVKIGGVSLYLDTTYKPLHHVQEFGTVVAPPENMPEWFEGRCEVMTGDRVRFHYHAICDYNLVVLDGLRYWLVPYEQLYYIEQTPACVQMLNNFCLVEPVLSEGGEEKTASGLITNLDATQQRRPVANRGILRELPAPSPWRNMDQLSRSMPVAYIQDADLPLQVGEETLYLMDYQRDLLLSL